ncbi:hypothetical protein LUW75_14680 [Streptomyces sp. MRC013]|uniref:hypothetical protein n=1 Tax=Streptomyces sp. MRC013 TaxID=2898276 RepID=UPI00202657E1|nr:hypothetical protein [Streptomyces sp. MRC013]URM91028.1 hypothetical protein LUW75_14680 [Streptomyces sp. MRC013]
MTPSAEVSSPSTQGRHDDLAYVRPLPALQTVYETKEDRALDPGTERPGFDRCEHLHQIPPNTDLEDRLKGFRQDGEPTDCTLDHSHRDKRLPTYGAPRALLIHLGFAWMITFIALGTVGELRR